MKPIRYNGTVSDILGSQLSLWPVHADNSLRIVSGPAAIADQIITVCLTRRGEDLMHPDMGLAPDLFQPLSDQEPEYLTFHLRKELEHWVQGVDSLGIDWEFYSPASNRVRMGIIYTPTRSPQKHLLSFPMHQYLGAFLTGATDQFLSSIRLNDAPLTTLKG